MYRTGLTNLPLHYGKAPRWLFNRMVKLAREIVIIIIEEASASQFLKKISDPFWFQAFGSVLGFDWHSSGITTTVCAAVKEGIKDIEDELGIFVTGGKGSHSRKTPNEILIKTEKLSLDFNKLIYASKLSAKVDNSALQDGYQLYLHTFFFTTTGKWAVVQQGMNKNNRYARRYHWLGDEVESFVIEPQKAICCDNKEKQVLNLVSHKSESVRNISVQLAIQKPEKIEADLKKIETYNLPEHHYVDIKDINPQKIKKILLSSYDKQPKNFEQLLSIKGIGPKTLRALALVSELIYGSKPDYSDPVRYSFAHGGKDGHPYPINRDIYDTTIDILDKFIQRARIERTEKIKATNRLLRFYKNFG